MYVYEPDRLLYPSKITVTLDSVLTSGDVAALIDGFKKVESLNGYEDVYTQTELDEAIDRAVDSVTEEKDSFIEELEGELRDASDKAAVLGEAVENALAALEEEQRDTEDVEQATEILRAAFEKVIA